MNIRSLRVADQIKRAIAKHLLETVSDPRVQEVMVTDVSLSADLKVANIFFYHLNCDPEEIGRFKEIERGLNSVSSFLKKTLSHELNLRRMPEIVWRYDKSIDEGRKIDQILDSIDQSVEAK
jgi:ribosome-binding factor A